ncbi:hypothetical protein BH11GEM2_BH11GEM2_25450 [soil metagenome]
MIVFLALLAATSLPLGAPEAETKVVGFEYACRRNYRQARGPFGSRIAERCGTS